MSEKKPNVLIILCDQLNFGVLSCNNGPVSTPNIDRLAKEGAVFDNITCTAPLCTPTRASLVTGKYPHNHGLVANVWKNEYPWFKNIPATEEGINKEDKTTEKILNADGYETHLIGKWHLRGEELPYYTDVYREHFEYTHEMKEKFDQIRKLPEELWLDWYGWALPVTPPERVKKAVDAFNKSGSDMKTHPFTEKIGQLLLDIKDTFDYKITDKTISCLKEKRTDPFMITCSLNIPHDPNVVPEPFYGKYPYEDVRFPENFSSCEEYFLNDLSCTIGRAYGNEYLKEFLSIYYSSVMMLDHFTGQILDTLDEQGLKEDTIVVFMSDHGDMAGGHGMIWKSTSAFYDEISRQSLIIRYPKKIKPGRCSTAGSAVDILPTILELCGVEPPDDIDGRSLIPYLKNNDFSRYVLCERIDMNKGGTRTITKGNRGSFMLRGSEWKYMKYRDGKSFMYNMQEDPGETKDLSNNPKYSQTEKMLQKIMERELEGSGFEYVEEDSYWKKK